MALFVHGILILWLVLVPAACYARYPRRLILAVALFLGLLFLPMVSEGGPPGSAFGALLIPGLALTKYKVLSLALILAVLIWDGELLFRSRPSWIDLPMILWCLCPIPSVLGSQVPPDGSSQWVQSLTQALSNFLLWGAPYMIGRLYFGGFQRLRELALIFVVGAILYVPFCLYEVRMSPQLHSQVYGFSQHDFIQTMRGDGYRPMVFLQHGLALGMILTAAMLLGFMMWWRGAARHFFGPGRPGLAFLVPCLLLLLLATTTVLTKSTGALMLGAVGMVALVIASRLRTVWPVVCLLVVCPLYLGARTSGAWTGSDLVPLLQQTLGEDRAGSFDYRQINEDLLMTQASEGPVFGWGGWGRNFVRDSKGAVKTVPDGLWIITLGERGVPGLVLLYLAMLMPIVRFLFLQPLAAWGRPECAGALACAVVVVLYMIDNLMNAMHNPVFIMMAGGLAGLPWARAPVPPKPLSITDRRVFQWSLSVTRQRRLGIDPNPERKQPRIGQPPNDL
jgi:hypothetical protein